MRASRARVRVVPQHVIILGTNGSRLVIFGSESTYGGLAMPVERRGFLPVHTLHTIGTSHKCAGNPLLIGVAALAIGNLLSSG